MNDKTIKRIAMWSGPRNISTAMMRAWENRPDTNVVDEPFYACYLTETGIQHPMQQEVLASQSANWNDVIETVLTADLEPDITIQYQKHMTQHMVSEVNRDWFSTLSHAFLIREPAQVVASYGEKRNDVDALDLGFQQQHNLFNLVFEMNGDIPPVIDSKDVLRNPEQILSKLCEQLNVPFLPQMLSWPAGRRESDGAWAPHWYHNVEASTGFGPYVEKEIELNAHQASVVEECLPHYQALYRHKL